MGQEGEIVARHESKMRVLIPECAKFAITLAQVQISCFNCRLFIDTKK